MKKLFVLFFAALALLTLRAQSFQFSGGDDERQALYGALDQVAKSVKASSAFKNHTVTILPIDNDDNGLIAGRLKNILTKTGVNCLEASKDPMWNEIMKEIAWSERKNDILDSASIAKLGKLKGAQILLYGKLCALKKNESRVYAEIELHACKVDTREHIWGDSFVKYFYTGKDVSGIISLDSGLRKLLKKNFDAALKNLQSPSAAAKLNNIKTVTVVPLVGDIDRYITGLAIEMLSQTKLMPRNPRIPSLGLLRSFARDGKVDSDAVFYGAIRDLQRSNTVVSYSGEKVITSYIVSADVQLFLENIKNNDILWSSTIPLVEEIRSERSMTDAELKIKREQSEQEAERTRIKQEELRKKQLLEAEELRKKKAAEAEELRIKQEAEEKRQYDKRMQERKDKAENAGEIMKADLVDNWQKYLKVIGIIVGVIALLAIIVAAIKAFFSFNNVR